MKAGTYKHTPETLEKMRHHRHSPETKAKISAANKGNKRPDLVEFNAKRRGSKMSDEARAKMSAAQKVIGNKPPSWAGRKHTEEWKKKHIERHTGKIVSDETKKKIGIANKHQKNRRRGENHPLWKGGVTSEAEKIRHSSEYVEWRTKVFERDNYTCQECGARNGAGKPPVTLNADHIKSFAGHPELRFDVENGRTLCLPCHKKTPNYGGKSRLKLDPSLEIKRNGQPYAPKP